VLITRREFVVGAAAGLATAPRIKAVAFDAFPIFDPRPVFARADAMFPGTGLSDEWRTRQFEYSWLRLAARHYVDFWRVTEDALVFAAKKLELRLSPQNRAMLMNSYLELKPWPDVGPALESMRAAGFRLAFLSNFTPAMLAVNIRNSGLTDLFEEVLSTDERRTYKPDARAYQLAPDALKMTRRGILFVASAGWDAAGAKMFGFPTFWVNRQRLPAEEMGVLPDASGETLTDLVTFMT